MTVNNLLINFNALWQDYSTVIILCAVLLLVITVLVLSTVAYKRASKAEKKQKKQKKQKNEALPAPESEREEAKTETDSLETESEPEIFVVETAPEAAAPAGESLKEDSQIACKEENLPEATDEKKDTEALPAQADKEPEAATPEVIAAAPETEKKKVAASPTAPKKAPVKKAVSEEEKHKVKGKWTVEFKKKGEYIAVLHASNGEEMLTSEIYTTEEGARNGISTIIKCIETGKFIIYRDKNNNHYYKLKTANNRFMCVGETYKTRERCQKAVESVKRIAADATVHTALVTGTEYVDYIPEKVKSYDVKNGATGKWKIEQNEDGAYSAKLYASNGQLMLATEEVSQLKTAEKAIDSVKKNSFEGNFIIDRDKFGRYFYKLRNSQKSVICIGEAYKSLDSCIKALESVRRFAATAIVEEF